MLKGAEMSSTSDLFCLLPELLAPELVRIRWNFLSHVSGKQLGSDCLSRALLCRYGG
jgi:hypothetical protein